jgi:hypothetical protein
MEQERLKRKIAQCQKVLNTTLDIELWLATERRQAALEAKLQAQIERNRDSRHPISKYGHPEKSTRFLYNYTQLSIF